jgi:F-type H+/Na+-transporting ATPase subunit alpha
LKQPQFSPVPVEEQVVLIYAGTRGYLDKVDVANIGRYERELVAWLRAKKTDLLKAISDKKDIGKDGIEDKIKAALTEFSSTFA